MNLLFTIMYSAHARGTHHKLALDALRHLTCVDADLWQRLFLKHGKLYLEGSKAPDKEFKDFKNHVLHTRDGYWGGAPIKARSWYDHLVEALGQEDWATAVYCAGVLSHYYTDPLHPFHTGQSEAENNIHRAVEWSISKSYDSLRALGGREFANMAVELPPGPNWLAQLMCAGAERSNVYYEKLIAHYDIRRGVTDPPAGLDRVAQRIVAELIRYATLTYALVLARALEESGAHAPDVPLAAETMLAAIQVPFKAIAGRIADAEERRQVERMYDELLATGTVEKNLPEDDRAVRNEHAAEVLARRPPPPEASTVFPFKPRERTLTRADQLRAAAGRTVDAAPADNVVTLRAAPRPAAGTVQPDQPVHAVAGADRARATAGLADRLERVKVAPRDAKKPAASAPAGNEPRFHLVLDQDVVDGPSIGPKTADRLYPHGIKTIRDLMKAEPTALAVLVNMRHITPEVITDWQDQARLVCTVPGLRSTQAQLLVGAGYRTGDAIASAEAEKLCADVLAFAVTPVGQRLLRNGDPPNIEKIKGWLEAARSVKAA